MSREVAAYWIAAVKPGHDGGVWSSKARYPITPFCQCFARRVKFCFYISELIDSHGLFYCAWGCFRILYSPPSCRYACADTLPDPKMLIEIGAVASLSK